MKKTICSVYRSPKKEGLYLYAEKQKNLSELPESLLEIFGKPELAMTLLLTAEKTLARADVEKVMTAIESQGYYLQMPPVEESYMQEINQHNSKLF